MDELTAALRGLLRRRSNNQPSGSSAELARVEQWARLERLEAEMAEVRGRINGLLFVVVGAVLAQLVLKLVG